jgi:hypothetical protein
MKKLLLLAFLALPLWGQTTFSINPDVGFDFGPLSATGTVQLPFSVEGLGIRYWNFEYKSTGFTGVSLQLEGAPDSSNAPGTFVIMPGTVYSGTNPATSTTGGFMGMYVLESNTAVWIRVHVTSLTGTGSIHGRVYGYRNFPGCTVPCQIAGQGPIGPVVPTFGTSSTPLSLSSSGLTQIIALSGSTQIRLTHISLSFASAVDFQLEYGTGSACGTGTTALTGVYKGILTIVLSFTLDPLLVPAGQALCVNLGSSVTGGGLAKYAQF